MATYRHWIKRSLHRDRAQIAENVVPVSPGDGTRARRYGLGQPACPPYSAERCSAEQCPAGAGTSSVGLRSKKPVGLRMNPVLVTGITGQSSVRTTCVG